MSAALSVFKLNTQCLPLQQHTIKVSFEMTGWPYQRIPVAFHIDSKAVFSSRWREEHKRQEWHEVDDDEVKRWKNDAVKTETSVKWKRCIVK